MQQIVRPLNATVDNSNIHKWKFLISNNFNSLSLSSCHFIITLINSGIARIQEWGALRHFWAKQSWRAKKVGLKSAVWCSFFDIIHNTTPTPQLLTSFGQISRPVLVRIWSRASRDTRGYTNSNQVHKTAHLQIRHVVELEFQHLHLLSSLLIVLLLSEDLITAILYCLSHMHYQTCS